MRRNPRRGHYHNGDLYILSLPEILLSPTARHQQWPHLDGHHEKIRSQPKALLARASVAAHELVDAASGVDELALTRVEGV